MTFKVRLIQSLVNQNQDAGLYVTNWNGKMNKEFQCQQVCTFYTIQTEKFKDTKKMILLK